MLLVTIKTLDKMSKVYIMNTKIINQCCINVKYINTLSTDVFTILSNIMVRFAKIVTAPRELDTKIISILAKHSIIDVWQDPLYASAQHINLEIVFISIEYEIAYIFIYFFNYSRHIESSQLIYRPNQLTGFYVREIFVANELKTSTFE